MYSFFQKNEIYVKELKYAMFTLLRGLWKYIFQRDEYYVLIIGLDNAGKTTFLEQVKRDFATKPYKGIPFEKISPTVGMNIGNVDMKSDIIVLWDLGGQEEIQSLWNKYYTECHGIIYMIDSSDIQRLEESYKSFDDMIGCSELDTAPLLVLANKQDKPGAIQADSIKEIFNKSVTKIGKRDCMLHEISALTGNGISEGLHWMLQCVRRNRYRPPREKEIT